MQRRALILWAGAAACTGAAAQVRPALPAMTEGPFYPSAAWRRGEADWDADLTRTVRRGVARVARGEHLGLALAVADAKGRVVDGVEIEIWQCDVMRAYRHASVQLPEERIDPGFQGFGAGRAGADGSLRFRTIRPVAYPGRTPHIHVRLRHAAFGEFTSQLFVAGEAGNARDFLWRQLSASEQQAAAMVLMPAAASDEGLRWRVAHPLVVPA